MSSGSRQRGYYRVRKPGPSSSSRRNLTDLTTIISRRRHWESRRAVILRRVRGQSLSVARLLSRSVRFYFALSQAPPSLRLSPLPRHLRLTLLFPLDPSFLVAFPTTSSRVLWLPRCFSSLSLSLSLWLPHPLASLSPSLSWSLPLVPFSRYSSTLLSALAPFHPSSIALRRSRTPGPSILLSFTLSRALSSTIPNSPFSLASFFLSLPTSFALFLSLSLTFSSSRSCRFPPTLPSCSHFCCSPSRVPTTIKPLRKLAPRRFNRETQRARGS